MDFLLLLRWRTYMQVNFLCGRKRRREIPCTWKNGIEKLSCVVFGGFCAFSFFFLFFTKKTVCCAKITIKSKNVCLLCIQCAKKQQRFAKNLGNQNEEFGVIIWLKKFRNGKCAHSKQNRRRCCCATKNGCVKGKVPQEPEK